MNTFNLNLDLDKRGGVAQWVTMRQGDHNGTELRATIYDHGTQAGGGYTCRVSIRLPGAGDEYYRETATYTNGVAVVTVDEEYAAAIVGVTEGYFELLQGDAVIASTESFGVRILRSAQDGAVPGDKYDSAIEDALAELDEATGRISQMVVDATAEYLEAHPEITTTVEDNSLTDAKLIQHGGILDRVARLMYRLDNLLTATPAEADALTVSDAAKTPLAGLALYGRSTQAGTPTPSAPVAIQSVEGNILQPPAAASTSGGVTYTPQADGTIATSGTATGNSTLYFVSTPTPIAAGTYWLGGCPSGGTTSTYYLRVAACTESGTTLRRYNDVGEGVEVTINDGEYFTCFFHASSGDAMTGKAIAPMFARGSGPMPYVPAGSAGLWAKRTSEATQQSVTLIPLQGHALRSLPDGTRDEVTVDQYGHAVLTQRVGHIVLDGSVLPHAVNQSGSVYQAQFYFANFGSGLTRDNASLRSDRFPQTTSWSAEGILTRQAMFSMQSASVPSTAPAVAAWLAENPVVLDYYLATPITIDLGTIDPIALQGPDLTAQAVPTAPFALTYERDLNTTLARLEASIAELATN